MTTILERGTLKPKTPWRREYPINQNKIKHKSESTVLKNDTNSELIKDIEKFELSNEPFPLWTEELTQDFKILNEARVRYQSLLSSKYPDYWISYSNSSKKQIEDLIKNYNWVKGSYSENSLPLKVLEFQERTERQKNPFEVIIEKCENAKVPRERLIEHASRWTTWILAKQKVKFTSEVKELVARTAADTIRILMPGHEDLFLQKLKERLATQLQKPDCPKTFFSNIRSGTIQEKVYPYIMIDWDNYKISKKLGITEKKLKGAYDGLKRNGIIFNLTHGEIKTRRANTRKDKLEDPELKKQKNTTREERLTKNNGFHSFEARRKMSISKGGTFNQIVEFATLGLSPRIISEISGRSLYSIYCAYSRMRSNKDIPSISSKEDQGKIINQSRLEKSIDISVKTSFEMHQTDKDKFYIQSYSFTQESLSDLIEKSYPPVGKMLQKKKEEFVNKVVMAVLENYQPYDNFGFHAQALLWISKNLPESPIYGKINQTIPKIETGSKSPEKIIWSEERKKQQSERMKKQRTEIDFNEKGISAMRNVYKQRIEETGKFHTLESRIKMSSVRGSIYTKSLPWTMFGLTPYTLAQIIDEDIITARTFLTRLRHNQELYRPDKKESRERVSKAKKEQYLDSVIKKAYISSPEIAKRFYLHLSRQVIFNLLPKIYKTVDLTLEEKEQIASETANIAIQDYDPHGKMGFHAHIIKKAVQQLTHCQDFLYLVK